MEKSVSFREKLAYGIGDAGCNFIWTTISSFLTLYYTDSVGISAAVVGTIMFITRLFDGFTDLGMGMVIDKTSTRWGKARPWVLWSAIPMALGIILVFNVPSGFSTNGKIIYAFITYIFVAAFAYTASNLSYNTLLSLVSNNQQDRATMSTIRFFMTTVAVLFISYLTMIFVGKIGWSGMSFVYGGIALVLLLITFTGTKERNNNINANSEVKKLPLKRSIKLLFKNKYFVLITALFLVVYASVGTNMGIGIYYARDVLNNLEIFGTLILAMVIPMLIGLPLFPLMTSKFGKWKCMMVGMGIQIIGLIVIMLFPTNTIMVLVGLVIKGLGSVPNTAGLFALVADVVDYGEWKNHERIDGLTYSATSFGMKVGTGLGTALVGWSLALGKYNAAATTQSETAIFAMKALYYGAPIILTVVAMILLAFINIDKIYDDISMELKERRTS